jgi:ATP-dependent RNA helicase DeaD
MSDAKPFTEFDLDERVLSAVAELGFMQATPIQAQAIPPLLLGRDVIGRARTGSGKTAAFGLPLLQRVRDRDAKTRGLVLCPTRELALQVSEAIRSYARHLPGVRVATIYGGAPYPPQIKALRSGSPIVVGTPGRLIDHLKRGTLNLDDIEAVVLDEADEMLRMGFLEDVQTILDKTPDTRQVMLFSASMPPAIQHVARDYLNKPITIEVEREALSVDHVEQFGIVVTQRHKIEALRRVLAGIVTGPTLVFARTRLGCAETADALAKLGVAVDALHGNLTQAARERVLARFRARGLDIVIATDVAARGLDVDHISHVINLDLPAEIETYVHRIGRTGRAGRKGTAISFLTPHERRAFQRLQKTLSADIGEMYVPSDDEIARHKQTMLLDEITRAVGEELADADRWVQQVASQTPLRPREIAAAAIHLLAKERGTTLETLADLAPAGDPPHAPKPRHAPKARIERPKRGVKARHNKASKKRSGLKRGPTKPVKKKPRKRPKKRPTTVKPGSE